MIIVLRGELFEGNDTDDLALLAILGAEHGERHKVRLSPAYRPRGTSPFHGWLERQSTRIQDQVRLVLERGLDERDFNIPGGEPRIIVERRTVPVWPDSFERGSVRLPLEMARELATRPLRLLLENGRNDWGFLDKIVPGTWKERWKRAARAHWLEPEMAGGITEIPNIIRQQVAEEHARRLRTWVMFDSDARIEGHLSPWARKALGACEEWSVSHHLLERRAIENYIPGATFLEWARRQPNREARNDKHARVTAYLEMNPEQRHYYNVKAGFKQDAESREKLDKDKERAEEMKKRIDARYPAAMRAPARLLWTGIGADVAQEVWGHDPDENPYVILESALANEGFDGERVQIFQSIFGML